MSWYCQDCGNQEEFECFQNYTEYGTEKIFFDGEGDIQDYGDRDSHDSESGDWNDIECCGCNGGSVGNYNDDEIAEMEIERIKREKEKEKDKKVTNWKEKMGEAK